MLAIRYMLLVPLVWAAWPSEVWARWFIPRTTLRPPASPPRLLTPYKPPGMYNPYFKPYSTPSPSPLHLGDLPGPTYNPQTIPGLSKPLGAVRNVDSLSDLNAPRISYSERPPVTSPPDPPVSGPAKTSTSKNDSRSRGDQVFDILQNLTDSSSSSYEPYNYSFRDSSTNYGSKQKDDDENWIFYVIGALVLCGVVWYIRKSI